ncbi:uncharacterized protein [Oryza sativa Japonica Group]|uniref:Expressed protein n=4 Tax=Oryza TaxID=4527 RepID=Q2QPC8_ORYSJ|nr:uncharacterized protein LOC4352415 [Oryza sativa Japonica Group]EEC69423.1 hypothetical protein OsI_38587 [Oryza sativa Indica Group]KAB8117682.1 hypothetical protein EE612_059963 [Oryza sativa]ABA98819.1 expressed protein [Oryza sativa Japonica Group]KAF2908151.1 hypothetical protein DAI22_12g162100 [Oryza sativa Japonica Group]BAF29951.1 Os12g0534700 [Oryza sativa Japonica Group]|eukprot:NP_001066932.1 Os12g0534700 [Oryza sativa Japonica Group]
MAAGEGEATTCHKRSAAGQEEEEESKRPRDGSEEEEELLTDLSRYRRYWTDLWSDVSGDIAKRTEFGPMRYTEEPVPPFAKLQDLLEVFSFEVTELKGILSWPIDVFGLISVRDSLDRNRNYIFERTRNYCQTLTAKDSSLVLTGPSRAVQLIDPVEFEIELRVKGTSPSKDKILSAEAFGYNCIAQRLRCGSLRSMMLSGARSTLEFKYAHIPLALEATIKVRITRGSTDFCGKFIAHTASIKEDVILLDSGEEMVAISHDGAINFSRSVVAVEGNGGVLTVGVHARQSGGENMRCSYKEFIPVRCGRSHDTLDVGFCQMSVEVAWSLIF